MTGEKNRFKTTEKLWDLDDKQLKTPVHDAMVLWLMDEDNLKALLYPLCCVSWEGKLYSEYDYNLNECMDVKLNCTSEQPIMSSDTFIAGYADLVVDFSFIKYISKETCPINKKWYDKLINIKSFEDMEHLLKVYHNDESFKAKKYCDDKSYSKEYYDKTNGQFIPFYKLGEFKESEVMSCMGYVDSEYQSISSTKSIFKDFFNNINYEYHSLNEAINFMEHGNVYGKEVYYCDCLIEVKPFIDSFGAVLRQLNSYKRFYLNRCLRSKFTKFCLFTFDDRFDKQFESQGIVVLHPWTSKEDMLKIYGLE